RCAPASAPGCMRRADAAKQSVQSEPRCSVPAKCTSLLKLKTPAHPFLFPRNCPTDFRNIHTAELVCTGENELVFSAQPRRSRRLGGESFGSIISPQSRRVRRGGAENLKLKHLRKLERRDFGT